MRLWYTLWLAVTGLMIYALTWAGAGSLRANGSLRMPWGVWVAAGATAPLGFAWGCLVDGVSVGVERWLLSVCVPAAAWLCWFSGLRIRVLLVPAAGMVATVGLVVLAPLGGVVGQVLLSALAPRVLWIFLAATLGAAVIVGWRADAAVKATFRRATLLGVFAFYAGYWIGWLRLWRS
jgi:hypothetical protein